MYKLTLAVITHNRANLLKQMLDSVLLQTYKDFYVIIYDNCSSDNTADIAKPFLSDSRFTYHRHEKVIGNFNYALGHCDTDYLVILHDDDIMLPDMISEEMKIMENRSDVSLVFVNMNYIDSNNKMFESSVLDRYMGNEDYIIKSREYIQILMGKNNIVCCPTVMFRMALVRKHNFNFTITGGGGDLFLWLEMNQIDYNFYYISKALYNYRQHSAADSSKKTFIFPKLRVTVYNLLLKNNYPKEILKKWIKHIDWHLIYQLKKATERKKAFNEIKNIILFNDKRDNKLLFNVFLIFYIYPHYKRLKVFLKKVFGNNSDAK